MNRKLIAGIALFGLIAICGYKLGSYFSQEDNDYSTANIKHQMGISPGENSEQRARNIASISENKEKEAGGEMVKELYKKNKYLNRAMNDTAMTKIFEKNLELFKESPNAEDFAVWISLGLIFDSSSEYGQILSQSLGEINENNEENFHVINQVVKQLGEEDSFIRGQILNLVNAIDIERTDKILFFGSEASREVVLDDMGRFSPDSLNITTSMALLKQVIKSEDEAHKFIEQSIERNENKEIREKLISRFSAYFPSFKFDLEAT